MIVGAILFSFGCKEDFLENPPLTTITDETFPATANDAYLVTNAAYNTMRNWWYMGGYPLAGVMSDDQTKGSEDGSNPDLQAFESYTYTASHGYILAWYQTLFQAIRRANVVIYGIEEIVMDEALKERYIAEASFIRAYTYFTLIRVFGDVPMIQTLDPERIENRTAVDDIYDQMIIPDLISGIDILPERSDYSSAEMGRITKGAAKALLARVYLNRGDFDNTEKYVLEVINSAQYSLEADYSRVFSVAGQFGSGSIFELASLPEGYGQGGNQFGNTQGVRGTPNWGWGFGRPSWDYINAFEPNDPRLDASVIFLGEVLSDQVILGNTLTTDTTRVDGQIVEIECYNQKVYVEGSTATADGFGHNRRILRYADVLLMAAEALNENDQPVQALTYLNMVRERARGGNPSILPDISTLDKVELRNAIWHERRVELAFENVRYYDLKRQGRMAEVLGPLGFTSGKNEWLPIPQQEIDLSGGILKQNQNYGL